MQPPIRDQNAQSIIPKFGLVDKFGRPLAFTCSEYHRNQLFQLNPGTKAFTPWGEGGCERSEQTDEG